MKRVCVNGSPNMEVGSRIEVEADEWHHLTRVLRARTDETIEVLSEDQIARARLVIESKKSGYLQSLGLVATVRESSLQLRVIIAFPVHRQTFDEVVPGLVQLGVNQVVLTQTAYSGRLGDKRDRVVTRYQAIARQSRKQCGRVRSPELVFENEWSEALELAQGDSLRILFHPGESADSLPSEATRVCLAVGSEGGFSEEEVAQAIDRGFVLCNLGPRILRAETAIVGACFWAQRQYGDGS